MEDTAQKSRAHNNNNPNTNHAMEKTIGMKTNTMTLPSNRQNKISSNANVPTWGKYFGQPA